MIDTSPFSSLRAKLFDRTFPFVFPSWLLVMVAAVWFLSGGPFYWIVIPVFWSLPFTLFITLVYGARNRFLTTNKLTPYLTTWRTYAPQLYSLKKSSFLSRYIIGNFGDKVYGLPIGTSVVPFSYVGLHGCLAWIDLGGPFPHMVIDSRADSRVSTKLLARNIPRQRLTLEGDFPEFFSVYCEPGEQMVALQILSPDRMAALIDIFPTFNVEFQGNFLRIYVDGTQRSSAHFKSFIQMLGLLEKEFKVSRLKSIRR